MSLKVGEEGPLRDGYADLVKDADRLRDQLRRNLLKFIEQDTELGFTFLETAQVERKMREEIVAGRSIAHAQQACDGARYFLERTGLAPSGERERLLGGIETLQKAIRDFLAGIG